MFVQRGDIANRLPIVYMSFPTAIVVEDSSVDTLFGPIRVVVVVFPMMCGEPGGTPDVVADAAVAYCRRRCAVGLVVDGGTGCDTDGASFCLGGKAADADFAGDAVDGAFGCC